MQPWHLGLAAAALAASLAMSEAVAVSTDAAAPGVEYSIALAGLTIGEARIQARIGESQYRLSYDIAFDLLVWSGSGRGEAIGRVTGDGLRPDSYRVAFSGRRERTISVDFAPDGRVTDYEVAPPFNTRRYGARVAILPDQLSGVVDPLTALIIPDAEGTLPAQAVCVPTRSVFSGAVRFDLETDALTEPEGGRVACSVTYRPVAGHRFESDGVERLSAAPLPVSLRHHPEAGAWLPERATFPTRFGDLVFEQVVVPESEG